jgi:hypothetical protein
MQNLLLLLAAYIIIACEQNSPAKNPSINSHVDFDSLIGTIKPPPGFVRKTVLPGSFGDWLRTVRLRKDGHVYLYNGRLKTNQDAQFAVLDIPVGNKDLQQCADAIMRLRAEYFFSKGWDDSICFHTGSGKSISFSKWLNGQRWRPGGDDLVSFYLTSFNNDRKKEFENYLETVFNYCGTYSLSKELRTVTNLEKIKPGDVFIKGGFPGHAMIVVDVAENNRGEKVYMLAQGYMPAQDIHIVKNPAESEKTPWYKLSKQIKVETPEWTFQTNQLKTWN